MYQAKKPISTVAELDALLAPMHPSQVNKIIDHIDDHCRAWLERTTFVTVASCNADGQMDVSPKGDPPGFVKVLDSKTLAIPDRIGNYRADTFRNVVNGHRPDLVLLVRVNEAFFHCGKAMIRSRMWQPEHWGSIEGLPTYSQALKDHGEMDMALDEIEQRMAFNESDRLY